MEPSFCRYQHHWRQRQWQMTQVLASPHGASRLLGDKESVCQCGRCKTCWFHPWVWKIPWKEMATYSGILAWETGYNTASRVTKSQTWLSNVARAHTHTHTHTHTRYNLCFEFHLVLAFTLRTVLLSLLSDPVSLLSIRHKKTDW